MKLQPDSDCRMVFENSDISSYFHLNGVTKLFMYDKVFQPELILRIGEIVNSTSSIQYIVSTTKDIESFGFNVKLVSNLGCLTARGSQMRHTFYLYKHNHYDSDIVDWIVRPDMKTLIQIASDKELRLARIQTNVDAVLNSERLTRSKHAIIDDDSADNAAAGKLLFDLLMVKYPIVNDFLYDLSSKTKFYAIFNETNEINSETDILGFACMTELAAVKAPSWDGKDKGKILIKLIRRKFQRNRQFIGIIYDIATDKIAEYPVKDILQKFNYQKNIPIAIKLQELLEVNFALFLTLSVSLSFSLLYYCIFE
jgi:hypothetical protein